MKKTKQILTAIISLIILTSFISPATASPPVITRAPYNRDDNNTLSTDPAAPTAMSSNIMWEYYDDQTSCKGVTHQWQYRVAGTADPMTLSRWIRYL